MDIEFLDTTIYTSPSPSSTTSHNPNTINQPYADLLTSQRFHSELYLLQYANDGNILRLNVLGVSGMAMVYVCVCLHKVQRESTCTI